MTTPTPVASPEEAGWIPWAGGERPVAPVTLVAVRYRNGMESSVNEAAMAERKWFRRQSDGAICLMGYPIRIEQRTVKDTLDSPFLVIVEGRQPGEGARSFEGAKRQAGRYADEIDAINSLPMIDEVPNGR